MRIAAICAGVSLCLGTFASPSFSEGVTDLMSGADPEAGAKAFRQCKACHTVESGGANRVGPNLYGVVGRAVASVDGFKYSSAMQDHGGNWDVESLDAFLENPRKAVPRTRMSFRGISDPQDRADMIAYLNTQSVEETYYACTACHSEMIVAQQGKTRDGWKKLLVWMVEEQGMSELPEDELNVILDYLAANYGTDRPNFPKP